MFDKKDKERDELVLLKNSLLLMINRTREDFIRDPVVNQLVEALARYLQVFRSKTTEEFILDEERKMMVDKIRAEELIKTYKEGIDPFKNRTKNDINLF